MPPAHVRVGLPLGWGVAEMAPTFDDLFRRPATDAELQPAAGDQVCRARVLYHVERILVPHVDDGGADLDAVGPGTDCGKQREGRRELLGKVMDAKICAVRPELFRGLGQFYRLLKDVARGSRGRLARCVPMAKGEEADLFHGCRWRLWRR